MVCKSCGNNRVNISFENNSCCNLCKIIKNNIKEIIEKTLYIYFFDNKYYIKQIVSAIQKNDLSITPQVLNRQKKIENDEYFKNNPLFVLPPDVNTEEKKININNLIITQKAKFFLNKTIYCEIPIKQIKKKIINNEYYVYLIQYILSLSSNIFFPYFKCITQTNITDAYLLNRYIKNFNNYYNSYKNNIPLITMKIRNTGVTLTNFTKELYEKNKI